jgi:uncharacterized protein (DUF362 family)
VGRDTELTRIAEAMGDADCRRVVVSAGAHARRRVRLAERCDARLVAAYAAHAAALAADDADALLAVAEELAAIGAMPYAVDAAAQAAAVLVRAGRHDAARRAAVRIRELHVPGQASGRPRSTASTPRPRR